MRTWLILSCLAVTLLVVSAESGALQSRVTKELLLKLLRATKDESLKKTAPSGNLRERVSRVLHKVHDVRDEQKRRSNAKKKLDDSPVSKLVELLRKTLNKRQPDEKTNAVKGNPPKNAPVVKDPIKQPRPKKHRSSSEEVWEPIDVVEGSDIVEIETSEEANNYFMLELFASDNFCTTPIGEETIDRQEELMTDMYDEIITVMNNSITALDQAGPDDKITAVSSALFGGFETMARKEEHAFSEGTAMLFRYILYGTEHNPHCSIGAQSFDYDLHENVTITDRYERMACIAVGMYLFEIFTSDMFDWSTEEDIQSFEEDRCNTASKLFWEAFPDDVEDDTLVEAVTSDLECIVNKLKDATITEEEFEEVVEETGAVNATNDSLEQAVDQIFEEVVDEETGAVNATKDPLEQALDQMLTTTLQLMTDIEELSFTLMMAHPLPEQPEPEKRVLMKSALRMVKRHHNTRASEGTPLADP